MRGNRPFHCAQSFVVEGLGCRTERLGIDAEGNLEEIVRRVVTQTIHELRSDIGARKDQDLEKNLYDMLTAHHDDLRNMCISEFHILRSELKAFGTRGGGGAGQAKDSDLTFNLEPVSKEVEKFRVISRIDDLEGVPSRVSDTNETTELSQNEEKPPSRSADTNEQKATSSGSPTLPPHHSAENAMALCAVHGWVSEVSQNLKDHVHLHRHKQNHSYSGFCQEASENVKRTWAQKISTSLTFHSLCTFAIFANSLFTGWVADQQVRRCVENHEQKACADPGLWSIGEHIFSIFFIIELLIRMVADKTTFFTSDAKNWNMFDLFVVLTSCSDLVISIVGESGVNISFIRVLRVLRLVRIVKTIRVVRFFRELRVMVYSILECANSLLSALALLCLVIYVFAVFITQYVADFLASGNKSDGYFLASGTPSTDSVYWNDEVLEFLIVRFGTLGRTMLSMYQAVTGGIDWGDLCSALMATTPHPIGFGLFFACFVAFTSLALMNIVTGIFVDNATKATQRDRDELIHEELASEGSYMNDVKRMFEEADLDHSGELSWKELEKYLQDPRTKAYFNALGLQFPAAKGLFKLLDIEGKGRVSSEEFVVGCARLKGGARSVDIATLMYENKKLSKFIRNCMHELKDIVTREEKIDTI